MQTIGLIVILLAVSGALLFISRRINVPHPVLLVVGGAVLALSPGMPEVKVDPDTMFLIFIPPLLYWAALNTSFRDFSAQSGPILRFATLVVLLTMLAVAMVVHGLTPEFTWGAAFLLGAIVAPPDPVAAIAVMRNVGVPRTITSILEGEGLVNDATALVCYQIAVVAVVSGEFSVTHAALRLVLTGAGGVVIGLAAGWLVAFSRKHLLGQFPIVENTLSLLSPFLAYLPAQWLGLSGVLAVVALGLYLGRRGPRIVSSPARVQAEGMWTMLQFLLESLVFALVGLELPEVMRALRTYSAAQLLGYTALVTLTVIVVRIAYTMSAVAIARAGARRKQEEGPRWSAAAFIAWTGIRGGDSLVIALALPLTTATGARFPARELIIVLTFGVIFATLVLQGLTLSPMVRWLHLEPDDGEAREDTAARLAVANAGLHELEVACARGHPPFVERLRAGYLEKRDRLEARVAAQSGDAGDSAAREDGAERQAVSFRELRRRMISAEREAVITMRDTDRISDDVMRRIQRELDLETMMLDSVEDDAPEPYDEADE